MTFGKNELTRMHLDGENQTYKMGRYINFGVFDKFKLVLRGEFSDFFSFHFVRFFSLTYIFRFMCVCSSAYG